MAVSLERRAADDLRFIRSAMERSSTFTAVPGAGGIAMGVVGVLAAIVASGQASREQWLATWIAAALVAFTIGLLSIARKAARAGMPLTGNAGRRFALSLAAPLVAGAALTVALAQSGHWSLLPAMWLLLYGAGIVTGGVVSIPVVLALGLSLMATGLLALVAPPAWGDTWLATGFGLLQMAFGAYIRSKHGG
jgi:hypothetical protein